MKYLYTILLVLSIISCSTKTEEKKQLIEINTGEEIALEDQKPYSELKTETINKRDEFRERYTGCKGNRLKQDSVLKEAQAYLLNTADHFFKAWYNTPWTFEGHTQTPREGSIACGYFVTTTLRDMGFNIPRIKWAQQASEPVIIKMTSDIRRFQNKPIGDIVKYIKEKGEGLYVVGLDCHVGYIYYKNKNMSFVHANYYKPKIGVMSEPLVGRNPLNDSKYRIIGKIFDTDMVRNWILNTSYPE